MALFQSIIEISSAIEIYKFLHDLSPAIIMGDITKLNKSPTYNLRTLQELYSRNPKTVRYGTETIFFFDSEILGNSSSKYKKLLLSFII